MQSNSLEAFYAKYGANIGEGASWGEQPREVGHFNVFNVADLAPYTGAQPMLFDRRLFYKISLCTSPGRLEYGDRTLDTGQQALFLATPRVPYRWVPNTAASSGYFCIFNEEFLRSACPAGSVAELPLFQPGAYPLRELTSSESQAVQLVFEKMVQELTSAYTYKYDVLRTYLWELLHLVQKLQPATTPAPLAAAGRLATRFGELLERQFPLHSPRQPLGLRTPADYADHLAVHVNYLNRALKAATGHTTTALIGGRLAQEAKILLRHTTWSVSQIADMLGFTDAAHFGAFFKRQTTLTPGDFRR